MHHNPSLTVSRRGLLGASLAVPLAGALTSCGDATPDGSNASAPEPVTYLTNFGTLGRDSYAWLAARRGLYEQAGLAVSIEPGSGTNPNLQALLAGQAQFAAVDLAGAAIAATEQDGFVAIAAIQQRPLAAVMAYADSEIASPADLAGRQVGLPSGAVTELLFPAYLEAAVGVSPGQVEQVSLEPAGLVPALASGRVDAIGQFVVGEPLIAAAGRGRDVVVLPYDEYLGDLYGVGLFTTVELAAADPELCVRFRDALLGGLELAMAEPAAAGQVLADEYPETDPEVAAAEMAAMTPYSEPLGPGVPLGQIDGSRMARHIALLSSVGLLGRNPVLEPEDLADFSLVPGADH